MSCSGFIVAKHKAAINYTAKETGSLRWLNMLLLLTFAIILLPLAATIFTRRQLISSVLVIFPFLLLLFQHVVLCYNMLARNYILIAPANGEDEVTKQPEMPTDEAENGKIDRLRLEQYILTYKPYLNPDFKITDLVKPLNTNRSYLSNFINTTYATNFSSYINRLRVNEYNSLVNMPEHEATPRTELVAMAGFGSYKTFLRWQQKVNEDRIDGSC